MYTVGRPPTPALPLSPCIPIFDEEDHNALLGVDHNDQNKKDQVPEKPFVKSGRLLIGRWGRRWESSTAEAGDPPEVVVLRARLHTRTATLPLTATGQQHLVKRPRQKDSKKSEKKFINEQQKFIKADEESVRNDGRVIASKVLPIMAMLLQRSDGGEDEFEEKEKPPVQQPALGPRLAVQCIQLLPSDPGPT